MRANIWDRMLYTQNAEIHAAVQACAHIAVMYARDGNAELLQDALISFFAKWDRDRTDRLRLLQEQLRTELMRKSPDPLPRLRG